MAIFTFTRDGRTYQITAPEGASEAQAEAVLSAQIISGTLVGQPTGTTIDLATQVQNGLSLGGVQAASSTLPAVDKLPESLPTDTVSVSDLSKQLPGEPVGSMNPQEVRGILAARAKQVGQTYTDVSDDKGLGVYGLKLPQLEQAGYLKPGTSDMLSENTTTAQLLKNPNVWTGKNNVSDLDSFTANPSLQQKAQQSIYQLSYNTLSSQGLVSATTKASDLGAVLNTASTYSTDAAASWLKGSAPAAIAGPLTQTARAGQYATTLSQIATSASIGSFASGYTLAGSLVGFNTDATATRALSVFEKIYRADTPLGRSLQTGFGSFGQKLANEFSLGGEYKNLTDTLTGASPVVAGALDKVVSTGQELAKNISTTFSSIGGASVEGNTLTALGSGQIGGSITGLLSDAKSTAGSFFNDIYKVFDVKATDALGQETTVNLLSNLRLDTAAFFDKTGDLFGVKDLGQNLLGFGGSSGLAQAVPVVGTAVSVFSSFFGGGAGDSSGLNFSLTGAKRTAPCYQNCTNRSTVDAAVNRCIGTGQVPDLGFGQLLPNVSKPVPIDQTGVLAIKNLLGRAQATAAQQLTTQENQYTDYYG